MTWYPVNVSKNIVDPVWQSDNCGCISHREALEQRFHHDWCTHQNEQPVLEIPDDIRWSELPPADTYAHAYSHMSSCEDCSVSFRRYQQRRRYDSEELLNDINNIE